MKDHFNISHLTKLETFHDDVETSALYNSFCLFIYLFIRIPVIEGMGKRNK